jgi:non-heme chloroperoxidase
MHPLYLKNAVPVGRFTDGDEVTRYIGRHGTKRVAKAVLTSAIPPLPLKTGRIRGNSARSVGWLSGHSE